MKRKNTYKSKPSVTIGISAFNEEKNIVTLINSILLQKELDYFIKEILILSDGSTDSTTQTVGSIINQRIRLIKGSKRLGKPQRLNQIFRMAKGDIIVLLDADVILSLDTTILNLLKPFSRFQKIGLVSGWAQPKKGKTFIENCINTSREAYDEIRRKINHGHNAHSCEGRILALSKKFAKFVYLPPKTISDDSFLYFTCLSKGFKFRMVDNAKVLYRSPSNLGDHIRQNTRFVSRDTELKSAFGDMIPEEYRIPKLIYYQSLFREFLHKPVQSLAIFFINFYCKYKANQKINYQNSIWQVATTTKGGIND